MVETVGRGTMPPLYDMLVGDGAEGFWPKGWSTNHLSPVKVVTVCVFSRPQTSSQAEEMNDSSFGL